MYLVVRLFGNISSRGPGTVSACVRIFLGVFRDWMDMVFAKVRIMESISNIDFCGINESLVSGNAG